MSHYNHFYNNWLDIYSIFDESKESIEKVINHLPVNLEKDFFTNLKFDSDAFKKYRIEAAVEASKVLGNNPALCFSGGIDSQCMLQCFQEAGIKFTAYTLVFDDSLNIHDVEFARNYCKVNNIKLHELPVDIKLFLQKENYDYGIKYRSASPHFNTHFKMFDLLIDKGHTGICCGGDVPAYDLDDKVWGKNFSRNMFNYITYSNKNNIIVLGNFLSYYPKLSWSIALITNPMLWPKPDSSNKPHPSEDTNRKIRYQNKIKGYVNSGFTIHPQKEKYTGFELVKLEYEKITGDPLSFETLFRKIFQVEFKYYDEGRHSKMIFKDDVKLELDNVFTKLQQMI